MVFGHRRRRRDPGALAGFLVGLALGGWGQARPPSGGVPLMAALLSLGGFRGAPPGPPAGPEAAAPAPPGLETAPVQPMVLRAQVIPLHDEEQADG